MGCGASEPTSNNSNTTRAADAAAVENNNQQKAGVKREAAISEEERRIQKFRKEVLATHNKFRAKHDAEPLTQAADLDQIAQNWAEHLAKNNIFEHSNTEYGENLWGGNPNATGKEVTDTHYSEIKNYNFAKGGFSMNTGHFTQVVWKGSKELGTGYALDKEGMAIVCCNYRPAGNCDDDFVRQVSPLK